MSIVETAADRLTGGKITKLTETTRQQSADITILRESLSRLEQALHDPEWQHLQFTAGQEFSRHGLQTIMDLAQIMRMKNPVIKRGVGLQRLYVWAQGILIHARDGDINQVIQAFLDDERNMAEFTTHQMRGEKETDLQTEGNLFFRFFIDHITGRVRIRTINPREITRIICNPEDGKEPWYYERSYTRSEIDGSQATVKEFYPDWHYNPRDRLATLASQKLGGRVVHTPIYHVRVNPLGKWGVCEFYDALDWALAYKSFLEQLATVWQALARWAWKLTVAGGKTGVAGAKSKVGTTLTPGSAETNPSPVTGSVFIQGQGAADLQPFKTSGATMKAEDGRRLLLMAIMGFGFPETFYGDVSVGTLATARSLDRPTELKIKDRQSLWVDIHQQIFDFVKFWSVKAPRGSLVNDGRIVRTADGDEISETVEWNDDVDPTVVVMFPPIIEKDMKDQVDALVAASTLDGREEAGTIPSKVMAERLLALLGFQDVDEIMKLWEEEQAEMPDTASTEEAWGAMTTAAKELEQALREAQNG